MVTTKNTQNYKSGNTDWTDKVANAIDSVSNMKALRNYVIALGAIGTVALCSNRASGKPIEDSLDDVINYFNQEETTSTLNEEKAISFVKAMEKEERTYQLDSIVKNMKNDALENVQHWDTLITKIEQKYDIQQGLLAGLVMRESYANPIQLNRSNDGGAGIGQFQPGTAQELGLRTYDSSKNTGRDTKHGKKLKELVQEKDSTYSALVQEDERFDIEKALEATAQYLVKQKNRFGSWNRAIDAYNTGNNLSYQWKTPHIQGVRNNQLKYNLYLKEKGEQVDEGLIKELYAFK